MTKLVLYVHLYYTISIDCCGIYSEKDYYLITQSLDDYCYGNAFYSYKEYYNFYDLEIITDNKTLDELLLDDETKINNYGEIINYNQQKFQDVLEQKTKPNVIIKYMKIEELKDIDHIINKYIENKRKKIN